MTKSKQQNFAYKYRKTKITRINLLTPTGRKQNRRKLWDHSIRCREQGQEHVHCVQFRNMLAIAAIT